MAERGALPNLNQSTNRAAQAKADERSMQSLAAMGKVAFDGMSRNTILSESNTYLRDIVTILEYAEEMRSRDARQAMEDRLEAKRKGAVGSEKDEEKQTELNPFGVGAFLAGLTALTGAFLGIRGWERAAIKRIGEIKLFAKNIPNALRGIKDALMFNLFNTKSREVPSKFSFGTVTQKPLIVQIGDRIKAIRTAITTALFGAIQGGPAKLAPLFAADGKVGSVITTIKNVGSSAFTFISESAKAIFKPFGDIFTAIKGFMSGDGAGGSFLKMIGGTAGAFLRMIGRIFKPIGIIFSFGEGVMEFMKTEGSIFNKLNAGASRFLADFIGAPLDLLLVKLPAKVMELLGFENAAKWLKENIRFEDALFSILRFPMNVITGLFDAIKKWWSGDSKGAVASLIAPFQGIIDFITGAFDSLIGFLKKIPGFGFLKTREEKEAEELEELKEEKDKLAKRQLEIAEIEAKNVEKIAELKDKIERSLAGENAFRGFEGSNRKQAEYQIKILENQIKTNEALKKNNETKLAELEQENKKLLAKNKMPEGVPNQNASGNGSAADVANLTDSSNQGSGGVVDASNNDNSTNNSSTTISNSQTISGARVHPLYSNYSYG